ncbi:coiled-coil domain-containing protein 173-like [Scleropages formosus]|uniref:Cilia and flagella associated protein 210 n=1 Tax=Scleropages formosus TaxID=113540 RepID=A0A8C9V846_SCLFO|nr:coiled-coil domain-containing protein 173-like [Scleropages formosus]
MATVSSPVNIIHYERRKGSDKNYVVHETITPIKAPDLRQVIVLPKAEWLRIQDNLNHVNKQKDSLKELLKEREVLHLRSKEVVKLWSNTVTGQRQKKMEAKKIQEEIEEEEMKQIDLEEAKYKEQKRKEAIDKAKTQQYYQMDRVRRFHSGLLLTEVLKEREAQLELKQKKLNASRDLDRDVMVALRRKDEEDRQQEQHSAKQRRLKNKVLAEDLRQQIKESEFKRNQEKLENKKEAEQLQHLKELYDQERSSHEQEQKEQKRRNMNAYKEHMSTRDLQRALDAQREEMEEERRRIFAAAKEKMMTLRKEKEAEMFREVQQHKEAMLESLTVRQKEEVSNEEELIANAIAQREARLAQEQKERDEKKMAMLSAITLHREAKYKEQEEKEREEKQKNLDMLHVQKKVDRIFAEKQQLKAQKKKDDCKTLQDTHVHQMAERQAKKHLEKTAEMEFNRKNAAHFADEEKWFQIYTQGVIDRAAEAGRNTYPLQKVARKGTGGGLGPIIGSVRPSYLVHDNTGVELPTYISKRTQNIKERHATTDIQKAKKRLGFTTNSCPSR